MGEPLDYARGPDDLGRDGPPGPGFSAILWGLVHGGAFGVTRWAIVLWSGPDYGRAASGCAWSVVGFFATGMSFVVGAFLGRVFGKLGERRGLNGIIAVGAAALNVVLILKWQDRGGTWQFWVAMHAAVLPGLAGAVVGRRLGR